MKNDDLTHHLRKMLMKCLLPLLSVILLLSMSCSKSGSTAFSVKIKKVQGITYVENPANPKNGRNHYTLKEEYTLKESSDEAGLFSNPGKLVMDRNENFYIIDYREMNVLKFDRNGKFIKRFARQGQGPGELAFPRRYILEQEADVLHILDFDNNKITRYTTDGEFIADIRLEKSSPLFFYLVPRKFYYVFYDFTDDKSDNYYKCVKYSLDGHILGTSDTWFSSHIQVIKKDGITQTGGSPFDGLGFFACDSRGILYYAHSSKYEFTAYDPNFNKIRVVIPPEPKLVKIPREAIARWLAKKNEQRKKRGAAPIQDWYQHPDYYPFFKTFDLYNKDRLIFRTCTRDNINEHFDVFSTDGVYLEEMILHPPSDGTPLESVLWGAIFKDGSIYCLVMNKDDEYVIRKYSMVPYDEK